MNELLVGLAIGLFIIGVFFVGYLFSVVANLVRERLLKRKTESDIKRVKKNGKSYTSGKF